MKFITMAVMALAFTVSAQAKTSKVPGVKVSRPSTSGESSYTSSFSSFGGSYTHEIGTTLTSGFYTSEKACKDCDTGTNLTIGISYLQYWKDNMQWGAEAKVRMLSKETSGIGKSETLMDILGLGVYNIDSDLKNSVYAKAGVGFFSVLNNDRDGFENRFGLFIGAGKRFSWMNNISYNPEVRLVKKGDIDMGIEIALLNFSINW